ncbi:polysaccharide deacetylase family protein [Palleronia sp.]|uniref:polysaccharide deacetylase family protein n=1 Tax=Palleronia sp. TaxID=1940284 RepID=UPI0035C838FA
MGAFVISLDFELLWGVRDHADRESYGANVLGAREAVPRMLDLFAESGIRATWATVGFLMCEDRDELLASLPAPEERPVYSNPKMSSYSYLDDVGADEASDPYYFGASLVRRIAETPGQEIGTHTLSHYYCLEEGQTEATFEADLRASLEIARHRGIEMRSIVFPRNQYGPEHLTICERHGLMAYRGNPESWAYRSARAAEQTPLRRALRLADSYTAILGHQTFKKDHSQIANVPASRFLRPCAGRLAQFHPLHLATIKRGMTAAARRGSSYHLWWHPHNFGHKIEENLASLRHLADHYHYLSEMYGMTSKAMGEAA